MGIDIQAIFGATAYLICSVYYLCVCAGFIGYLLQIADCRLFLDTFGCLIFFAFLRFVCTSKRRKKGG